MATELDIYTGKLEYKDVNFNFVFNGEELRLIPPAKNEKDVWYKILLMPIVEGTYTMASPKMDVPYLIGQCNENGHTLIFLTKQGAHIGAYNSVLIVEVAAYILCKTNSEPISKMSFTCPELDCIYPVTQGFSYTFDHEEFSNHGILSIKTEDYATTVTNPQNFQVDGKDVEISFGISRNPHFKVGLPPLTLHSTMILRFEPTEDYTFIVRLWFVAKEFLQFMCYRRNIFIPVADLSTPAEEGKTRTFASFHMLNESGDEELETLQKGRFIKLSYLSCKEGEILNDIAANRLYTRHIPDTYASGRLINAARFVMITAAFEWEFRRTYPDGIPRDSKDVEIEDTAMRAIQALIDGSTGALKKKYKFLRYVIQKSDSLEKKVVYAGTELDSVIGTFGRHLYSLNDTELIYSEMGKRLAEQRNHFAHGDLDIDLINESILDLIYTERIVYAMQLRYYGIDDHNIQKAINDLFRCGIMIE